MKEVKLYLNNAGFCMAKESHAIKGGAKKNIKFSALFGLIQHPDLGFILFDTGYTRRFYEATRSYPNKIYANITKVEIKEEEEVKSQLQHFGISSNDIKHIILSHYHADHVGGLKDFPNATIYCSKKAFEHAQKINRFFSFSKGILKDLIPDDIKERVKFIEDIATKHSDEIFGHKYDLFNDGSIFSYDLPGHAVGQIGIELYTIREKYFLIADACWMAAAYKELKLPNQIVRTFFDSWKDYKDSVKKLHLYHSKNSEVKIIPTHCTETTDQLIPSTPSLDVL